MSIRGPIAVLGAGSWGTTLAWLLAQRCDDVRLWCRDPERAEAIQSSRHNERYLPQLELPAGLAAVSSLEAALDGVELVVSAVPTQATRGILTEARTRIAGDCPLLLANKGLELDTGLRPSQVAAAVWGDGASDRLCVLSGPNLAHEIAAGLPATTVIASENPDLAEALQNLLGSHRFRVYTNDDVVGVELGGALKNPIAIVAGICDGLGVGDNAKAGVVTRGLAEISRLALAAGARPATLSGLSGMGDLIATAYSGLSRNHRLGLALGRGEDLETAQSELGQVAEGVPTTKAACLLAGELGVELPITAELRKVLFEGYPIAEAIPALMRRELRREQ